MKTSQPRILPVMVLSLVLSACQPAPSSLPQDIQVQPTVSPALPTQQTSVPSPTVGPAPAEPSAEHHSDVDLTHLTLGNLKVSSGPQRGYVWSCMAQFNGSGVQAAGAWLNGDGTWDLTRKLTVDGAVEWPHEFTITVEGDKRVFQSNDLPDHPTGVYPISPGDDAYTLDRNPNSIQEQSVRLELPANPILASQASCVGGEVGIMLSGVLIFNAFDAEGRDAPANEVQDGCHGHPQNTGLYHYHDLSSCIEDTDSGHSALMGYAFDGFGIYGYYGEDGGELTNADLDDCHGHMHTIEWGGRLVEMYHYHATHEFPYVVGCYRGTNPFRGPVGGAQVQPGQENQPQEGGQAGGPPQAALDACVGLTLNAPCTVDTPNGVMVGTCQLPPQSSQLACAPPGGAPPPP